MLDKNKIQIEILKTYLKGENVTKIKSQDNTLIAISGNYAYVLNDDDTLLNLSLLPEKEFKFQIGKKVLIDTRLSVHTNTCIMRKLKFDDNSGHVYVNEKIYKNFKDCKMFGTDENSPIFCYNDIDEPFGIMMPIHNSEDKEE